jgi:serine/threonine protein kinase
MAQLDNAESPKSRDEQPDPVDETGAASVSFDTPSEAGSSGAWKPESLVGTSIADKYEILSVLGQGGMSVVFKARHLLMKKSVAIKVLLPQLVLNPQSLKRFQQEASASSSLSHPNVITVYDFGVSAHGLPYLVMDLLHGVSLADEVRDNGPLEVGRALKIFIQAADALCEAHRKGVIHRDLKPSNIMLESTDTHDDVVKIVDFGIAKVLPQEGDDFQKLTQTGEIFGSPYYMSPEQCRGEVLDARSDIYSFACLMYEALTGKPPLVGSHALDTMYKHMNVPPPGLVSLKCEPQVRERLDAVILKCLAKERAQRYQTMKELEDELELLRSGRETTWYGRAQTIWRILRAKQQARKPPRKVVLILAGVVAVFGVIIAWILAGTYQSLIHPSEELSWRKIDTTVPLEPDDFKTKEMGLRFIIMMATQRSKTPPEVLAEKWGKLGQFYKRQQLYPQALDAFKNAMDLVIVAEGAEGLTAAQRMGDLADIYYLDGQYKQAEPLYRQILAIIEKTLGQHQYQAIPLTRLGDICAKTGRFDEAEAFYQDAIELFRARNQSESVDYALAASRLGDVYRQRGRYLDAESAYRKALEQWQNMTVTQPQNLALCHANLALMLAKQKRYADAQAEYKTAVDILGKESLLDHPGAIQILQNYSDLLWESGKYLDSLKLKLRVLELALKNRK